MFRRSSPIGSDARTALYAGHSATRIWPLLTLLAVAVLLPSAGVLWFMARAVENERLAVRERLTQAYRAQLLGLQGRLEAHWHSVGQVLGQTDANKPLRALGALRYDNGGVADSAIIRDANGQVVFPRLPQPCNADPDSATWLTAQRIEEQRDFSAAAAAWAGLAEGQADADLAGRALQAQVRCLLRAGLKEQALAVLTGPLAQPALAGARQADGRYIVPNAMLLALELIDDRQSASARRVQQALNERVSQEDSNDTEVIPSAQGSFLMERLSGEMTGTQSSDPITYLALSTLEAGLPNAPADVLTATGVPGLWCMTRPDGRAVALFREGRILKDLADLAGSDLPPPGTALLPHVGPPDQLAEPVFLTVPAGTAMPDWSLSIYMTGGDPFIAAARRQAVMYVWIALLLVAGFITAAALVGTSIARQMRVTRLKNDLIATVSHELKTPLASMRVLVDTLLEDRLGDPASRREYLELIARENLRLSRLIDNFLSFSRMERNKRAFTFEAVRPADAVAAAVAAAGDRFGAPGCQLTVNVPADLPAVRADRDALVTVILNLLDNAWKYTGPDKRISITAQADGRTIRLSVADNGIGLSRRAARRVFDRFYQVDHSLTRSAGGVGLGLSIVKFIVEAHGGVISVDSRLGEGSTFVVVLPVGEVHPPKEA